MEYSGFGQNYPNGFGRGYGSGCGCYYDWKFTPGSFGGYGDYALPDLNDSFTYDCRGEG